MKYLCFLRTHDGNEHCQIIHAQSDDEALDRMERWAIQHRRIRYEDIASVAGVWERNEKYYQANSMADLENDNERF